MKGVFAGNDQKSILHLYHEILYMYLLEHQRHSLVWHVIESKLFSFMQITQSIFLFKLTINKVISLKYNGDNSTNDAVNPVTLALHNSKSINDVPFRKKKHFLQKCLFFPNQTKFE